MKDPPARVLLYHCVCAPPDGVDGGLMITAPETLEKHVVALQGLRYRFVTAGELARLWRGDEPPPGIAVVTFDDGWRDGLTTVAPLLARLGVRGTFFVCPGGFGNHNERLGEAGAIMTTAEAAALHAAGMEIASHTLTHRNVLELSDDELRAELVNSRSAVEAITGERCTTLAYPTGRHDARVERAAADAGYELAFACRRGPWRRFAVPRSQPHPGDSIERLLDRLGFADGV